MTNQDSILDKIIESQEKQQAASFSPNGVINNLFKNLSSKESDILSRRFGLLGKNKETLEQIGKHYDITRERIRQIETATIKKLKDLRDFRKQIEDAEVNISHLLENYGGVMEENFMLQKINETSIDQENTETAKFLLTKLLNDKIEQIKADSHLLSGYKLPIVSIDSVREAVKELVDIIAQESKLLRIEDLLTNFKNREFYQANKDFLVSSKLGAEEKKLEEEINSIIDSYLRIAKNVDQNILGEWGLNKWNEVKPKRMSDKVYLVLRKHGKPLHFTEITDLINQVNFDKKTAYPATIHNELILDKRYVLVGRGIYALKDWGYQEGTVMDTIVAILKKKGTPLTKEEIVQAVLEQRIVKKSTIYLALTNKDKITKLPDGKYTLTQ